MEEEVPFQINLNIDYEGSLIDQETKKNLPVLSMRVCIKRDLTTGKLLGHNISSGYHNDAMKCIEDLGQRVFQWSKDYGQLIDITPRLEDNTELIRKFNNWMSMNPNVLSQEKTLEIEF